jgi:hypothetical protein
MSSPLATAKRFLELRSGMLAMLGTVGCLALAALVVSPSAVGETRQRQYPLVITGMTMAAPLTLDNWVPLELSLTNPNTVGLSLKRLTAQVGDIHVSAAHGTCTAADFRIIQFSGGYGAVIAASHTSRLSELGIATARWPQLSMINLPVNQDGCKNATIALHFTGEAGEVGA